VRYAQLATRTSFTAVLGRDMPADPAPGVRGARLAHGDPIADEWCLLVLGPHFAGALLAKLAVDGRSADDRIFDFVITFDRDVVIAAARPLIKRVLAANTNDSAKD
jgi:DICT domain-containing protein